MKKPITLILIASLGLGLFACGAPAPAAKPESDTAKQEETPAPRVIDGEEEWPIDTHSRPPKEYTQEEYDLAEELALQEAQRFLDTGIAKEIDYESIRIFGGMAPRGFQFKYLDESDVWTWYLVEHISFEYDKE